MFRLVCTILISLACAANLLSAPLDRRQMPAEVKWFIHLDADAARNSQAGMALIRQLREDLLTRQLLAKSKTELNLDPTQDLNGITVYGTELSPDAGVLVVRAKLDHEKLLSLARAGGEFIAQEYRAHMIYSWTDGTHRTYGVFADDQTLIVSRNEEPVKRALDALGGRTPVLADTKSPLAQVGPSGSIIEAGAEGLAEARSITLESPVLRLSEYGIFSAGEHEGMAFCHATDVTRTPAVADNLKATITGFRAFAQLSGDPDISTLLAPLKVSSDDRKVKIEWQMPAPQFADLLVGQVQKAEVKQGKGPQTKPSESKL
jgi:hypothetical protein